AIHGPDFVVAGLSGLIDDLAPVGGEKRQAFFAFGRQEYLRFTRGVRLILQAQLPGTDAFRCVHIGEAMPPPGSCRTESGRTDAFDRAGRSAIRGNAPKRDRSGSR